MMGLLHHDKAPACYVAMAVIQSLSVTTDTHSSVSLDLALSYFCCSDFWKICSVDLFL